VSQNHDDMAARLRDEASATAPERLRADVMLRVRAEPRPQRIRPRRRGFGRSFVTVAAAACILGAMVFGLSRVDFGGGSASGGGSSAAADKALPPAPQASGSLGVQSGQGGAVTPSRLSSGSAVGDGRNRAIQALPAVPRPLKAAIYGRYHLAAPIRQAFGAIDPHQGPKRR